MIVLRNILFYVCSVLGSLLLTVAALAAYPFAPHRLRTVCDIWARLHNTACRVILGIRIVEEGQRPDHQAFYAIKHEAMFEAIAVPALFDYPALFAKKELFGIPGWGRVARLYGLIPVSREDGAKALRTMLKETRPHVEAGRPIVIFPEGTRLAHGSAPPLRSGFAALYKLLGLPVVPVAVDSGPTYHRVLKRPGTITIRFGEVIEPGLPRAEIEARVHAGINALNDAAAVPGNSDPQLA